jgi:O-antigen/teichoic acid export membrane protein
MISLFLLLPRLLTGYRFRLTIQRQIRKRLLHFSFANFIGEILWQVPILVLPLIIINILGAEANAYFYIARTIAWLPLAIPASTAMSLFAEGSSDYREEKLGSNLNQSFKLIAVLLIPAILILVFFGEKLLLLFGVEYSENSTHLLQLLALAALPASINLVYLGILRVERKLIKIIVITGVAGVGTLALSYLLLPQLNILGVGAAWLATQTMIALMIIPAFKKYMRTGK